MTKEKLQKITQVWFFLKIFAIVVISLGAHAFGDSDTAYFGLLIIALGGFMFWVYDWIQFDDLQEQINLIKKKLK